MTAFIQAHAAGQDSGTISIPGITETLVMPCTEPVNLPQLQRLRRQFIALNRQHTIDSSRVGEAFVGYLNDAFEGAS